METVQKEWKNNKNAHANYSNRAPEMMALNLKNNIWLNLRKFNIEHLFMFHNIYDRSSIANFALLASKNNISINNAILARPTNNLEEEYYQQQYNNFLEGKLLPNTLYIGKNTAATIHAKKYCALLDGYLVCSSNKAFISSILNNITLG